MDSIRRKIMIVDDSITNLIVGRNLLKPRYETYLAPGAAHMFEILEKVLPDLILLDINMPDMDGYKAIKKLKADGRFANVPVIFLTSQTDEASERKGLYLGAADFINKPFSPLLLFKRIEHQLLIVQQQETIRHIADNLSEMMSKKARVALGNKDAKGAVLNIITLTKEMEIGVPEVDAQHKELVDRLNKVLSMGARSISKEETETTLDFLEDYVVRHFGDEEKLQERSFYPKYEWHKNEHQLFVLEFQKLKKKFSDSGFSAEFALELNNSVIDWIVKHIKSVDAEFGKYYRDYAEKEGHASGF